MNRTALQQIVPSSVLPCTVLKACRAKFRHLTNSSIRHGVFFLSVVAASVISWPSLRTLIVAAYNNDQYTHTLLILPISLYLIATKLKSTSVSARYRTTLGLIVVLAALLIGTAGLHAFAVSQDYKLSISVFALVLCWLGLVIAAYGLQVFKSLLFPLLFLLLMVPLPPPVMDKIIYGLQTASLHATSALFKVAGVPVQANGFVLSLPGLDIEVARQCSGIRSSIVIIIAGLIVQYCCLRSTWTRVIFVASVVPLAIAKNTVRIFTLSVLAMRVSPEFLEGRLHHSGGIVFFLLTLAALLLWLKVLQRLEGWEHSAEEKMRRAAPSIVRT